MVQLFNLDDENFFYNGRRYNNGGSSLASAAADAADGGVSLIEKYNNSGFGSCERSSSVSACANRCFYDCMVRSVYFSFSCIYVLCCFNSITYVFLFQINFLEDLNKLPPLNLRLAISKSLAVEVEMHLSRRSNTQQYTAQTYQMIKSKRADFVSQQITEKMKASNFPALELKIGSWEVLYFSLFI